MNTFDNILDYIDVDDVPVKKWFCVQVMIQNVILVLKIHRYNRLG